MLGSKLMVILSVLDKEEKKQIQKMLKSPFFTNNSHLLSLYHIATKIIESTEEPLVLEKKEIYKQLFPSKPYSDVKMRNLMRDLTRILEQWIVLKQLRVQPLAKKKHLAAGLLEKKLLSLHQREINKMKVLLKKEHFGDASYYRAALEINDSVYAGIDSADLKKQVEVLHHENDLLEQWYQIKKASINARYKSLSQSINHDIPLNTSGYFRDFLQKENPVFRLFTSINELYRLRDNSLFQQIIDDFFLHLEWISPVNQNTLFSLLLNFAIQRMKWNDAHYNAMVFQLYKQALEHNILLQNKILSSAAYYNIVNCGAKENAFEWIENFRKKYNSFLHPEQKEETITLADICLCFHHNNYKDAIALFNQSAFPSIQKNIVARSICLRCAYEQFLIKEDYYDFLESYSLSFERFVR
ncbi:MAG TPA: hypothetical protein ENJ45_00825, partial [Phaeodactylibacter sp.]|nr:hypothetical protein [Phaeodactylibacter sp.]